MQELKKLPNIIIGLIVILQFFVALFFIDFFFKRSRLGLEFTDEGLYLISAVQMNPEGVFNTPSGAYTNLMLEMVRGSVAGFRNIGALILFISGCWLGHSVYRSIRSRELLPANRLMQTSFVFGFGFSSLHFYFIGLMSPGYNWLTLFGLILSSGSLIAILTWLDFRSQRESVSVFIILGFGTVAATFGKPSSLFGIAALLGFALLMRHRELSNRIALVLGLTLPILIHHLLIQSWQVSFERFKLGLFNYQSLVTTTDPLIAHIFNSTKNYFFQAPKLISDTLGPMIWVLLIPIIAATWLRHRKVIDSKSKNGIVAAWLLICIALVFIVNGFNGGLGSYSTYWFVVISTFSFSVIAWVSANTQVRSKRDWLGLFALLTSFAMGSLYALGSDNGFGNQYNVSIVILFAGVVIMSSHFLIWQNLPVVGLIYVAVMPLLVFGSLKDGLTDPYRLAPMSQQVRALTLKYHNDQRLYVDESTYLLLSELQKSAQNNGWVTGTPILDMTPFTPTALYVLDAMPPPTLLLTVGGWTNWTGLLENSMVQITATEESAATWSAAWLLMPDATLDPSFNHTPNPDILAKLGKTFPDDYVPLKSNGSLTLYRPR